MDSNNILELHNHLALTECFKKHLIEDSKPKVYTYPSNGGYSSSSYGGYDRDRCNCKFYEWSDLNSIPKIFNKGRDFFKFLDDCHISYTQQQKDSFNVYYNFYATCVQGEARIIIRKTLEELRAEFKDTL